MTRDALLNDPTFLARLREAGIRYSGTASAVRQTKLGNDRLRGKA